MLIRSIKGVLMNMIEDVSDDKEGQMALQRAVEKHQSKQKKKENENNGQKTILGKDEKTEVPKYIKEGIEGIKQAAFEGKGAFSNSVKEVNATVESFDLVKATSTDEEKKIIEDINLEDQIVEGINAPTEGNKKSRKLAPKKNSFVTTKRSLEVIHARLPLYDHDFEKANHFIRKQIVKHTDYSNLDNFQYGNFEQFRKKHKDVPLLRQAMNVKIEETGEYIDVHFNPILLTEYQLVKDFLGRRPGSKDFKKVYNFLTQDKFKSYFWVKHYNKEFGTIQFSWPLFEVRTFYCEKEKKEFVAIYPNIVFYEGLLITDQRIMQNVGFDIFEKLKKTFKENLGIKSFGNRGSYNEHLLLTLFNHIIKMNNQDGWHDAYPINLMWFKNKNCISPRLLGRKEYGKFWKNIEDSCKALKKHGLIEDFKINGKSDNAPYYSWELVFKTKKISLTKKSIEMNQGIESKEQKLIQ